ncbi:MAG: murein biosynthesis integral membrane protein MurJ [Deltaproteobacteria bacterium]|nr:murein biosynthesis integral membrane protein MurJ [Deltaproteobacteria bacterium]
MSEASRDGRQLTRSAGIVGLFTLFSRILGLVRDGVVAAAYPKRATDPFYVAFTIPNVFRQLLAEGSLTVAFVPVFTELRQRAGDDAAKALYAKTMGAALLVLLLVTAAGVGLAPQVVRLFAYGLVDDADKLGLAILLTRVMFPFLITVGVTALAMGVLNTYRHFAAPALAPVLLNACIISVVLTTSRAMPHLGLPPIAALGFGVLLGGVAQVLLQAGPLRSRGLLLRPRLDLGDPGVRRIGRLMLPSILGLAIYQVNVILARQFASFLEEGSISYIYYAQRLIEFPMGIFAVAVATVSLPSYAAQVTAGNLDELRRTYGYSLRVVAFVLLPATAGLIALGLPLCSVLFQRGAYTHAMAQETARTLLGFACGLWAAGGVRQTVPVFYALQDTRTPVKVGALALLAYIGSALLLRHRLQALGLALAVAISSTVNLLLLLVLLRVRLGPLGLRSVALTLARSSLAAVGAGFCAHLVTRFGDWPQGGRAPLNYAVLLGAVVAGMVSYALLAALLRAPELHELARAFARRRRPGPR